MTSWEWPVSQPRRLDFCSSAQTKTRSLPGTLVGVAGRRTENAEARAAMRRETVERWWITAIERAKSKVDCGCGRFSVSATMVVWGS